MRYPVLAALCILVIGTLPAQQNRDDLTPCEIRYDLGVAEDRQTLSIGIEVDNLNTPFTRIAMPNWMPGAYRAMRFGESVKDLRAIDRSDGHELEIQALDHQTWSIGTEGVRQLGVRYVIPPTSRRFARQRPQGEVPTGLHFQGPGTFMYVVGAKDRPVTCRYSLPEGWEAANGLLPTADASVRAARDYDTFIDAPTILGVFRRFEFDVAGTPISCVFWDDTQAYDFDMPAFVDVTRRIVEYEGRLFGTLPFPFYVFLFTVSPFGGGGLEHLNSTSIGLNPAAMKRDVLAGASVTAHEFFHTWNVKRIRPVALGPFEYQHENYTSNLWVSEGWTSYYGDLTLVRSHLIEPVEFLSKFEGLIRREFNKERRKEHSVTWASRNVWHRWPDEEARVDYYAKGEILGALIDLKIRHATQNRKSLDDVMRFFNRWFAERNVGFEEHDVERACTAVSNLDLSEFFARHVWGTVDPPIQEILAFAGIEYSEERRQADFPFTWRTNAGRVQVRQVGSDLEQAGLHRNDLVVAVNGERDYDAEALLTAGKAGGKLELVLQRDGQEHGMDIVLVARETITPHLAFSDDPTPLQLEIRKSWLGIP